eukprot:scaffold34506_cov31-Tisochrysis_lutea.AAC.1
MTRHSRGFWEGMGKGAYLLHLHIKQEVVSHLIENCGKLLIIERDELAEVAPSASGTRLQVNFHARSPQVIGLNLRFMPRLARDLHVLDPRVSRGRRGQRELAVVGERLDLSGCEMSLIQWRH